MVKGSAVKSVESSVRLLLSGGLTGRLFLHVLPISLRGLFSRAVKLLLHEGKVVVELLRALRATFCKRGGGAQGHQAGKHQSREFHRVFSLSVIGYLLCP